MSELTMKDSWIYSQSTGILSRAGEIVARGLDSFVAGVTGKRLTYERLIA